MQVTTASRKAVSGIAKCPIDACPCCSSLEQRKKFDVIEHEYTTTTDDTFPLVECQSCGAWFLNPRPDKSALDVIYPPNYYAYAIAQDDSGKKSLWSKLAGELFKMRMAPIAQYIKLSAQTRWLEVGCGGGYVLQHLREVYGIEGVGIDLSQEAVENCRRRGFVATAGRFEDYHQADGEELFDIVHSAHLIEHVESPRQYMSQVASLLKPGGLCVFATPNTAAWEARFFGRHWGGLHVPRHWALLDAKSAEKLGQSVRFQHLATKYSTNGAFWNWSMHSVLRSQGMTGLADTLFPSDQRMVASGPLNIIRLGVFTMFDLAGLIATGCSSNMLVIFRKPDDGSPSA